MSPVWVFQRLAVPSRLVVKMLPFSMNVAEKMESVCPLRSRGEEKQEGLMANRRP